MVMFKGAKGTLAERFERKTMWEPNSGCLLWIGAETGLGYGRILADDKVVNATHVAMRLAGRQIPDGQRVLHRCDNRYCVNVDHLFIGSNKDNVADMMAKGRHDFRGLTPAANRISDGEKQPARDLFDEGCGIKATARATGRPYSTIRLWFLAWGYVTRKQRGAR